MRDAAIRELYRRRPKNRFGRWSAVALLGLIVVSWASGGFDAQQLLAERRLTNVGRFLGELRPYPLQGRAWDWGVAATWAGDLLATRGATAAALTVAISVAAILLAALLGLALSLTSARSLARAEPYLPAPREPGRWQSGLWQGTVWVSRAVQIFLRSLPEYVWAFLFVAVIGPSAWPAILALAIHNSGILGKLNAEVVENLEPATLASLRGVGASRRQIALVGILPAMFSRCVLYFFYRWESCVREATVLGILGIVSLGYWIQDARARNHYDEMLLLILVGSAIVLVGDLISTLAREAIRRRG